jgi:ABC-type branched-subunit amino acid transport system ATPase component/MFS family permease
VKTEERPSGAADAGARLPIGIRQLYNYFAKATGGEPIYPLAALFSVFFIDQFDTAAFGVLAPDIQRTFDLSDTGLGVIAILNFTIVLAVGVPLGFYADRLPRRTFVWVGAIIAGVFSFLTGVVGILALFILVRLGNGVGLLVNTSVHQSLLSDYYKPQDWPAVLSIHRNGDFLGAIIGPAVVGAVAAIFSWQAAFMMLVVPIIAVGLLAFKLWEPLRGGTEDRRAAEIVAEEKPPPFDRSVRTLMSIKTLHRQYIAWIFIGAGFLPLAVLTPLYFEEHFNVGPFGRGLIISSGAAATLAAVMWSRSLVQKWLAKGMGEPLSRTGWVLLLVGLGIGGIGASPFLGLSIALYILTLFVGGLFWVPFTVTQFFVSPARFRTLSLSLGNVFLVVGVWLLVLLPGLFGVSDRHGPRWVLMAVVPYWVIGGLILRSGRHYVLDDATRSLEMLQAAANLREERLNRTTDRLLIVKNLDVAYDQTQVLFGVDFDVREGELVALLGTNGAGKSTLLKAISGLVNPMGGSMFFDGEDITFHEPEETAELGIIQMPGGKSVFPSLSVKENLDMAAWMYGKDTAHLKQAYDNVYDVFPVLKQRLEQQAGSLSGGEQQMLSLAQAFIAKPKLLMIDELSLGLAPVIVQQLLKIVTDLNDRGTTIILVEQSVNVALTVAKHAYFMEKGQIRFDGTTSALLKRTDILRSVFLEGAQAAVGRTGNGAKSRKGAKR